MRFSGSRHRTIILLAEQQPLLRNHLQALLERDGYEVLSACDGDEALSVAARCDRAIDLLVTSSQVGSMTGLELGNSTLRTRPEIRVLMISSVAVMEDAAVHRGYAFLRKPFMGSTFRNSVRDLLALRQQDAPPVAYGRDQARVISITTGAASPIRSNWLRKVLHG